MIKDFLIGLLVIIVILDLIFIWCCLRIDKVNEVKNERDNKIHK